VTREELRRRVIEGLEIEVSLFGGCSDETSVARLPGALASVSPSTADRSIFNWYSWYGSSDAQGLTEGVDFSV